MMVLNTLNRFLAVPQIGMKNSALDPNPFLDPPRTPLTVHRAGVEGLPEATAGAVNVAVAPPLCLH
jgi:hypothetical protein